jgi:hypothetical protein
MRKAFFCFFIFFISFPGCDPPAVQNIFRDYEVAVLWADMTLYITKDTPSNSPTFASRALGYIGLTMYESVVHSSKSHRSLVGQLNALHKLPVPEEGKEYNWSLSLNAGQAAILKSIYVQTSDANKMKVDSLEAVILESLTAQAGDKEILERSVDLGRGIAAAIFEWSKTDGGHRGYLFNFDTKASYPNKEGCWKAPFFAQTISRFPLHPHWGKNRTFLTANADWKMPAWIPFNSAEGSEYFNQFKDVYESNDSLTDEQKEIAVWWNDDPSDTFTPPGHSYNLASIVVKAKTPDLVAAAETYARVGLSVADAFIVCWKTKYFFYTERPSTFITEHIDDQWEPFWPDPPFPAFPSGHATQASAVATVLADLYGDNMEIVDNTHSKRPVNRLRNVAYRERKFNSFWQVAEETAYSRFLGGIHSEYDNRIGLAEGKVVGGNINRLKWRQ